jgi:predicted regulator of Ras-like GTPase activity (Roadblock/LC7/MglB family)
LQDSPPHIDSQERFRRLQELLFEEDREVAQHIREEVEHLRKEMVSPDDIQQRVQPFIELKVDYLQKNFPELFGPVMAETIKKQIVEQQDEMIDALYPIIGKLIRKFLTKELERLQEKIDQSLNETFSWEGFKKRMRGWFRGESSRDMLVREMVRGEVEEVFIVDQDSGLLAGAWSRKVHADRDMVAGMLTAIKSFVETAFEAGQQELETIEYENYKIVLHNYHTFYIAVIVSGPLSADFKAELSDLIMAFAEKHSVHTRDDLDEAEVSRNSNALKSHLDEYFEQNQ